MKLKAVTIFREVMRVRASLRERNLKLLTLIKCPSAMLSTQPEVHTRLKNYQGVFPHTQHTRSQENYSENKFEKQFGGFRIRNRWV